MGSQPKQPRMGRGGDASWKPKPPPRPKGSYGAGLGVLRKRQVPAQVPLVQVDGQLQTGEAIESLDEPPADWRPPYCDPELWRQLHVPELGLSDAEWIVLWAYFGPGRGHAPLASKYLVFEKEADGVKAGTALQRVERVLQRPHVQEAMSHIRTVLSMTCLAAQDLRAWWSSVIKHDRIEFQHRLAASSHLAKSLALFVDKKTITHDIHVDVSQLSSQELAQIAAGGTSRLKGRVVDATLETTLGERETERVVDRKRVEPPKTQLAIGRPPGEGDGEIF